MANLTMLICCGDPIRPIGAWDQAFGLEGRAEREPDGFALLVSAEVVAVTDGRTVFFFKEVGKRRLLVFDILSRFYSILIE